MQLKNQLTVSKFFQIVLDTLFTPVAIVLLTHSAKVCPEYGMHWGKRMLMGGRFWYNSLWVTTGTNWRAHLVMAMKLLETPRKKEGSVVECGCWKGGATVNLSRVCAITGRKLIVYDSFEGLPPPVDGDFVAERAFRKGFMPGAFAGQLEEVRENVRKYGSINSTEFVKGWYEDTLPHHEGPIAMMFLDVDFCASLHDCLINLWPHVVKGGFVFLDEYLNLPYCAVFFSEKYWDKYFASPPPGLAGTGTGIQVGMHFTDHRLRFQHGKLQQPHSVAYAIKGSEALWEFYPDEQPPNSTGHDNPEAATTQS
ncbi:MAG: TylF/MycF/NovP-related O-methyltransferase [Pseudomonadota bacterium]